MLVFNTVVAMDKRLQIQSGGAVAGGDDNYHENSISRLIEERRESLEEKKILRKSEWRKSINYKNVLKDQEVKASLLENEAKVCFQDLAYETLLENLEDAKDREKFNKMRKLWGRVLLANKTKHLFSLVLPILHHSKTVKLEEAFHCRLICKAWKRAFDSCLQQACKIEANRSSSWSDLTKYAFSYPTSSTEQTKFLGTFPPERPSPFLVPRCLKMEEKIVIQEEESSFLGKLQWAQARHDSIDGLFLDFNERDPRHSLVLIDNPPSNLKQLGISNTNVPLPPCDEINARFSKYEDIIDEISGASFSGLEALALYNVYYEISRIVLQEHRKTLKIITEKGKKWLHEDTYRRDPIEIIKYGPFPNLKTLILESGSCCPVIDPQLKEFVPALEELEWKYASCTDGLDVLNAFQNLNMIGGKLRHLCLQFLCSSKAKAFCTRRDFTGLRLHLPQLETLEFTIASTVGVKNIDFILRLESLKELKLTFYKMVKGEYFDKRTQKMSKIVLSKQFRLSGYSSSKQHLDSMQNGSEEIIQFAGYEDKMYESNVWDILPDLRKLKITIITIVTHQQGPNDEEVKATRVYTRDELELQLKYFRKQKKETVKVEVPPRFARASSIKRFHQAVRENRKLDVINLIKIGGVDVNQLSNDKHQGTALHLAAWTIPNRDAAIEMIKLLIQNGSKVDVMNGKNAPFFNGLFFSGGTYNLPKLTWEQFDEFVEFMLESGNGKFLALPIGKKGCSVLHLAMQEGILGKATIRLLYIYSYSSPKTNLLNGVCSTWGNSLLYYAISYNQGLEKIKYLIKYRADWKHLNDSNWNFLHVAARYGHVAVFKYFFELEPNFVLGKTKDGFTPVDFLRKYHPGSEGTKEILEFVQQSGVVVGL